MKTLLNKLIKETPCDVVFKKTDFPFEDKARASYKWWGRADGTVSKKEQIIISYQVSTVSQIASLLHEQIHAEHRRKGCKCYIANDRRLKEHHAMFGALKKAMGMGNKKVIYYVVMNIEDNSKSWNNDYKKAGDKVKKLKIYKKAKDLLAKAEK